MKLAKETTSFTWEIKGVEEIKKMDTWEAVHCEFKVSKFTWSLSLTSNDRYLYVVPSLVEPKNVVVKFAMAIMVLNNNNQVINTPILGNINSCSLYIIIIHVNGQKFFSSFMEFLFLFLKCWPRRRFRILWSGIRKEGGGPEVGGTQVWGDKL